MWNKLLALFLVAFVYSRPVVSQTENPTPAAPTGLDCHPLMTDLYRSHPNITLAARWCDQFNCDVVGGNPYVRASLFLPVNDHVLEDVGEYMQEPVNLEAWGTSDVPSDANSSTIAPIDSTRYKDGVLLVYGSLPARVTDMDKLVEAQTLNTIWSIPTDQDYYLNFTKDDQGNYYVQGLGNEEPVKILEMQEGCNGALYVTDRLIKPAKHWSDLPMTLNTTRDFPKIRDALSEIVMCNDTLISAAIDQNEAGEDAFSVWKETSLYEALDTTDLAVTMLVAADLLIDRYRRQWIAAEASKGVVTEAELSAWVALYQMLPGVYCDDELLAQGEMETMLGKVVAASGGNASFPMRFGAGQNDKVGYIGQDGPVPSYEVAYDVNTKVACKSKVQTIDGTPLPDYENHIDALRRIDLQNLPQLLKQESLPPRFMTCNPPTFVKGSNADDTSSSSSDSTALAIGLGVGLGCAALLAAAAGFMIMKEKKNRTAAAPQKSRNMISPFSSSPDDTDDKDFYDSELGSFEVRCRNNSMESSFKLPIPDRSEWEISLDRIQFLKHNNGSDWILGTGNWGVVRRALLDGKQTVAVKSIPINSALVTRQSSLSNASSSAITPGTTTAITSRTASVKDSFLQEMAMLKFLSKDPHIVGFYGAVLDSDNYMLVVECMEGGDLREALNNDRAGAMRWYGHGRGIAIDIALGLVFIHSNNVVHRDIKSKNILLDSNKGAKLADVGLARMREGEDYFSDGITGTFAWSAPELLLNQRCTAKVDIYSFGVVLWELCAGDKPVRGGMRSLNVPEDCPRHIADVIKACLSTNPTNRPTAKEILEVLTDNKQVVVINHGELKGAASKSPVQETKEALELFNAFGGSSEN